MKHYVLIGIILTAVLVSGCVSDGGIEIRALKSLEAVSEIKNPSVLLNEEVEFRVEAVSVIDPNHIFRLFLPEGVEYISGDFSLQDDELILEPTGQLGVNQQGTYLGEDAEEQIMKLDKTLYSFKVKGVSEGKHRIIVETGSKDKIDKIKPGQWGSVSEFFVELRTAAFCSAETMEKAVQLCVQQETSCMTLECVLERTRQEPTRSD